MSTISLERARGSAIIVAIFVLVVLSVLGAFILNVTSGQQIGQALDVQGTRTYQAAHYGTEWAVYQLLKGDCSTAGEFCTDCRAAGYGAPIGRNLSGLAADLSAFTVSVSCGGGASYTEGDATVRVYQVSATACNMPSGGACPNLTAAAASNIGYVERRISLNITN